MVVNLYLLFFGSDFGSDVSSLVLVVIEKRKEGVMICVQLREIRPGNFGSWETLFPMRRDQNHIAGRVYGSSRRLGLMATRRDPRESERRF